MVNPLFPSRLFPRTTLEIKILLSGAENGYIKFGFLAKFQRRPAVKPENAWGNVSRYRQFPSTNHG